MDTNYIFCPITNSKIDEYSCYLICEAVEGNIPQSEMPNIKKYDEERKICQNCKYHSID